MSEEIRVGDRVEVFLDGKKWGAEGWYAGTVVRIDPYSEHRSFHWVELDEDTVAALGRGVRLISVLNPRNIRKAGGGGEQ
jgi:hypothetical protein